jgi:hypothetical protein
MGKRWVGIICSAAVGIALPFLQWGVDVLGVTIPRIFGIISVSFSGLLILAAFGMAIWWYALPFFRMIKVARLRLRIKLGKGRKMLIALGAVIIVGGIVGGTILIISQLHQQDLFHTFSYGTTSPERLDKEMDFNISGFEIYDVKDKNLVLIIAHTMITNRSTSAKNITANMTYEFRSKDKQEATRMPFVPYAPPDKSVADLKAKIEAERQVSLGDYLKFPLLLEPQKSVQGFMLFAGDKQTFDKFGGGFPNPSSYDMRIYLEWTNLLTHEDFRMMWFPGHSLGN